MTMVHWLQRTAVAMPDAPAIYPGDSLLADSATILQAFGITSALSIHGFGPGARRPQGSQNFRLENSCPSAVRAHLKSVPLTAGSVPPLRTTWYGRPD